MLERQQAQLIAGIQAFYSMVQKGERLPPKPSEINRLGQPLVHQILQRLGVLDVDDPWDEVESEESKSESPTPKLDTVIHTNFPLQSRFSWPADTSSRGPVETSPPNSQISPQAWTMPSAGNTTLLPWVTAPCQLLDGEHRDTQAIARSTAGNYSYGDLSQWPRFGQDGLEQQTRGTLNQADPTYLTAYANQIPSSIGDPTALSGYSWSNLMGMTGDGNEQQQYL